MTSQNAFGLFQYVPGLSQGDPYAKGDKTHADPRIKGKQFSVRGPKTGKTADVYFDATVASSVYVGSKYTTNLELTAEYEKSKRQRQIVSVPFKPTTPSKTMDGLGSYFGTFGKWENMKTTSEFDKREKGSPLKPSEPRNFLTSPPKTGHLGLLGCRAGSAGVANEYKYENNPPPPRPKRETLLPFKPTSPSKRGLFTQDPHVTFTPVTYSNEGPPIRRARSSESLKPFKPSSVILNKGPAGRIYGTVNPFPEYQPQGPPPKHKTEDEDKPRVFRPSSSPKSMRTYSIVNMPRNLNSTF